MRLLFAIWAGEKNQRSPYEGKYVSGDMLASKTVAEGLAKKGHDVHYFSLSTKTSHRTINGVHTHHIRNPHQNGEIEEYFLVYQKEMADLCKEHNIQAILPRAIHFASTGAFLVGKKLGIPVVPTVESQDFLFLLKDEKVDKNYKELIRETLRNSRALILLTRHLGEDIKKIEEHHTELHVINDGVDTDRFSETDSGDIKKRYYPEDYRIIMCVARMAQHKRQDLIVKAVDSVTKEHPDARFVFVGDGPVFSKVKNLAEENNCMENVKFLGFKPNSEIPGLLSIADIVLCPTDSEGLPLSLLEGMAAGKPIIASNVPPFPDFIENGVNGYLVENNAESFAEKINHLLNDEGLREKMSLENKKRIKDYLWERTIEKTDELLRSL